MKRLRGLLAVALGLAVAAGLAAAGTWLGGLAGGLLIGVGVYVAPEVSGFLARRRERAAVARELLKAVSTNAGIPMPLTKPGPAELLRADRQVVAFVDRPELARLREWCDGEEQPQVLLLTGAGGVGKTRLALELAREREALGWICRIVRAGEESGAVQAARAVSSGQILLMVDYAETLSDVARMLRAITNDSGVRLRVLMLARSRGEWWGQLEGSTDAAVRSLTAAAVQVHLTPVPAEAVSASDLFRKALEAFALALDCPIPEQTELGNPVGPVPILVVHAAALLAVLDSRDSPQLGLVRVAADYRVLDGLLARERAFWLGAARTAHLAGPGGLDSVLAAQAVAVGCLFAAADEADAARLLLRVPGLADSTSSVRRKVARWLRQLYPSPELQGIGNMAGNWWGSLQPDLVAERHVVIQLATGDDLAASCLRSLGNTQARRVLTILARACAHGSDAPGLLAAALHADLEGLGVPAVEVAVQTGGSLGRVLATVLTDATVSLETLITLQQAIPPPTVALAAADAIVTGRIFRELPVDAPPAERARWADVLSTRLAQAGRTVEALEPAREAAAAFRQLAAADPDLYRPDLAGVVANLAVRLHTLGHPAEAAEAAAEAVTLRQELAHADPDCYLPDLAISLSNLSTDLAELGKLDDALARVREAVAIHQRLAQADPGRYLPELGASLVNLAAILSGLGRADEARLCAQESASIYRQFASAYPDRFLPDLAIAYTNLGALLADVGYAADAAAAAGHAVALYRQLADSSPDRYRPELTTSLTNIATMLSELGYPIAALTRAEEAVSILRDMTAQSPSSYRAELASALSNLGICLAGLGRHADALAPTEESVVLYRDLAETSPNRDQFELATSLTNLGIRLADLDDHVRARAATQEAVAIFRRLTADRPERYRPDLAGALADLGLRLYALGSSSAALPVATEAARIYQELAETEPRQYLPRLAVALSYQGGVLAQLGRTSAALTTTEQAVDILRELATDSSRYQAELANALASLAANLSALGKPAEALTHAQEAVDIYRETARLNPGRFNVYLAATLDTLARTFTTLDRPDDAAAAQAEAAALREQKPH